MGKIPCRISLLELNEMFHTRYMMSFLVYNPERLGRSVSLFCKTQCVEVRNLCPIPVHIGHDIIWVKIFYECFKELGQAAYYTVSCLVAKTYKLERSILLPHPPPLPSGFAEN